MIFEEAVSADPEGEADRLARYLGSFPPPPRDNRLSPNLGPALPPTLGSLATLAGVNDPSRWSEPDPLGPMVTAVAVQVGLGHLYGPDRHPLASPDEVLLGAPWPAR